LTLEHPRPLIGRAADVDRARALVLDEGVRLLTLVGPGGVGKTRLARALVEALAEHFSASYFVDLSPVHDPQLVLSSIAYALSLPDDGPTGPRGRIAQTIGTHSLLLVLDNFEQVASAALSVGELLADCPNLHLLVTSHEPLALGWEQLLQVGPLGDQAAKELFEQLARLVRPGASFEISPSAEATISEICRRLDGLPLAIELAAARTRVFPPETILQHLRHRPLALLGGGRRDAPARHRTLRDTIAWSYELLDPVQQSLFRQVSVFVDGFTLEGIQAVHQLPDVTRTVESLLDKHLLSVREAPESEFRYYQLETIREYAAERLRDSGEEDAARSRHAGYLVTVVEGLAPRLFGMAQAAAAEQLSAEHNNIRAALDWLAAAEHSAGAIELGLRLAGELWLFWRLRGLVGEGRRRLEALLTRAGVRISPEAVHVTGTPPSSSLARALYADGYLAFAQAATEDAQKLLSAALGIARASNDAWTQSYALHGLGHAALLRRDFAEARALYGQRLVVAQHQQDEYALGQALNALGEVARCLDEPGVAHDYYERSLQVRRRLGDTRGVAMGLANLGQVLVAERRIDRAREVLVEALELVGQLGHEYGQAVCVAALAGLAAAERRFDVAARLLGAASAAVQRLGNALEPADLLGYGRTLALVESTLGARFDVEFTLGKMLSLGSAAELAKQPSALEASTDSEIEVLSPREREIVALIASGYTSDGIAEALVISPRTADTHAAHIRDKLGLRSRAEIAAWAIRHRLA